MDVEARGSSWRQRLAVLAVLCLGAAMWAGVAFGGGSGGSQNDRTGAAHAKKAVKRAHAAHSQLRVHHDGQCPFHDTGASAQV